MCEHLIEIDNYIKAKGVKELFRGKAWSKNCNEWVYYDCIINIEKIKENIVINNCVEIHEYHDIKVSNELGFFCNKCKDGVIGFHPINDGENNF